MQSPTFNYTTFIRTTPERLWQALTDPSFTRRYWEGVEFETDWKPGSTMTLHNRNLGLEVTDPEQVVLEADPFQPSVLHLAHLHRRLGPCLRRRRGLSGPGRRRAEVEGDVRHRRLGSQVKLTVLHDDFDPGSVVLEGVSGGWLAPGLKTLLETGDTLPTG